jgi:hypothetical protein
MNDLKEVVEQKQGQPWKVEKVCDSFETADSVRKNLLTDSKDGLKAKVKFLPSTGKFVVKSRKPEEIVVEQKSKKNKKQTPTA